jgi:hypothetical protein
MRKRKRVMDAPKAPIERKRRSRRTIDPEEIQDITEQSLQENV